MRRFSCPQALFQEGRGAQNGAIYFSTAILVVDRVNLRLEEIPRIYRIFGWMRIRKAEM